LLCSIILCFSVISSTRTCIATDQEPIYIHADGSIDPSTSPISTTDNVTYNLTGNITSHADGIVIERNNTIIDGNGCSIQGFGWIPSGYWTYWNGILLSTVSNVTIVNTVITRFHTGIYLNYSSRNNLSNNNISANLDAIWSNSSNYNNISGNQITNNAGSGIYLDNSSTNILSNNKIMANSFDGIDVLSSDGNILTDNEVTANGGNGVFLLSSGNVLSGNVLSNNSGNFGVMGYGSDLSDFFNQIDTSNLVEGKPIYYLTNELNIVISPETYPDGIGFLGLVNCVNVTVQDFDFMKNVQGLLLANTSESRITDNNFAANTIDGLSIWHSSGNNISDNNFTSNTPTSQAGIRLYNCSDNILSGNNFKGYNGFGIELDSSSDNILSSNSLTNSVLLSYSVRNVVSSNDIGTDGHAHISLLSAYNNTLIGNNIAETVYDGIDILDSSHNVITGNNVIAEQNAVYLFRSLNNTMYHNNFASNDTEVLCENSTSIWDNGYPSGGNFWSDCNGTDSNQDGIGDTPYVIDENNIDHYPLMGDFYGPWKADTGQLDVISNSTVTNFWLTYDAVWGAGTFLHDVSFDVSGDTGTNGFCRVHIPFGLFNGTYRVLVNDSEVPYALLSCSNSTDSYLYFTYAHSTKKVEIMPEFPTFLILPLFMIATLLAIIVCKRRHLT